MLNFIQLTVVFQFSNLIKTGSFTERNQISIKWVCHLFFFFKEKAKEKSRSPMQRINRALIRIESHELNRCFELPLLLKHNPLHEAHWIFFYQFQNTERKCLFGLTQWGLINHGRMTTVLPLGNSRHRSLPGQQHQVFQDQTKPWQQSRALSTDTRASWSGGGAK